MMLFAAAYILIIMRTTPSVRTPVQTSRKARQGGHMPRNRLSRFRFHLLN